MFKVNVFLFFSDIDECLLGIHNCPQNCTNNDGSFECMCFEGFTKQDDGSCKGKSTQIAT